ncbi:unnamed protein product [Staurois parvus]|uniref:Uncharacterized protein n=1 Tax=Staurois parvus TaxID=386267 RepID=A0ABN9AJG8_9NEOB|nr:unnamed protein product [Staurois parvus]
MIPYCPGSPMSCQSAPASGKVIGNLSMVKPVLETTA